MKDLKNVFLLLFLFTFSVAGISQDNTPAVEEIAVIDTSVIDTGVYTVQLPNGGSLSLPTIGGKIEADKFADDLNEALIVLQSDEFPPKDIGGWALLLITMLPIINKLLSSGGTLLKETGIILGGVRSSTIAKIMSFVVSTVYHLYLVNWKFDDLDAIYVVVTAYTVAVASNFLHDVSVKYAPKIKGIFGIGKKEEKAS